MMQYENSKRVQFLEVVPNVGIVMIIISSLLRIFGIGSNNGRLESFFEYANTFAMFLEIGLITTLYKEKIGKIDIAKIIILTVGIILTESRTIFVLTIFAFLIFVIKKKIWKKGKKIFFIIRCNYCYINYYNYSVQFGKNTTNFTKRKHFNWKNNLFY